MSDIPYYFQEQQQTVDNDARMVSPDATSTAAGMTAGNQPYVSVPQYPVAPSQSAEAPSFWSQIPPLVWIGIGVLMANVIGSAIKLVKGGPQKMQEMAMEQMMKQMMNQAMKGAPGGAAANPFAASGGANPFGSGFPPNFPSSMPSSSSGASMQPPIETTAGPASTASTTEPKVEQKTSTTTEQASSYTATDSQANQKRKSAFVDVDATPAGSPSGASSSTTPSTSTSSSSTSQPAFEATATQSNGGSQANGASGVSGMLDMLKNPEMQKMLYPYLPEPMRNPETFEWMLNSPEYRDQLETMLSQQMGGVAPPDAVQELMKDADMNPDKMKAQFDALGMSPEEFVSKVCRYFFKEKFLETYFWLGKDVYIFYIVEPYLTNDGFFEVFVF